MPGMFRTSFLLAAAPAAISALTLRDYGTPAQQACMHLRSEFPEYTHVSNDSVYFQDNTNFWTAANALGPACDFTPSCASDLGRAVQVLKHYQSPFAIRGGGHMPIEGYSNINSTGVLLSCSNLTQLEIGQDSVHIGPGLKWIDVYKFLNASGKAAVGARNGNVGVPGFILGGGWSFYSPAHGWANNNLKSVTGVLADGSVVSATATNRYADLFWALRGGANSFALITDFEVKTIDSPVATCGIENYAADADMPEKWADAVYGYTVNGSADLKSSVIAIINGGTRYAKYERTYQTQLFYNGDVPAPAAFANYTAPNFNITSSTFAKKSMYGFAEEQAPGMAAAKGLRNRFIAVHLHANKEAYMNVVDTFMTMAYDMLEPIDFWIGGVANSPIPKNAMEVSQYTNGANLPFGDPMGVKAENYFKLSFPVTYSNNPAWEPIVSEFLVAVEAAMIENLEKAGLGDTISRQIYLNDADSFQDVWGGYPTENVKKLQAIREKYDPDMVFTKLMPGGWKVADPQV